MPDPFLDPEHIGAVPLQACLAALDAVLREYDHRFPWRLKHEPKTRAPLEAQYRGLVGARRVVLQAMQLELPLDRGPGQALGDTR